MFFKFFNRQVVSKEAGERNLQGNLSLKSRRTNKGRDGRRNRPFIEISDQEQVSTASALFSEAKPPTVLSCRFYKGGHSLMGKQWMIDGNWFKRVSCVLIA